MYSSVIDLPYGTPYRPILVDSTSHPNLAISKDRCLEIRNMFSDDEFKIRNNIGAASKAIEIRENTSLFDDIFNVAKKINEDTYKFHIEKYDGVIHKYDNYTENYESPHVDCNIQRPNTKLVICVQLSNYDEYEGCELVVDFQGKQTTPPSIGSFVVFPSFAPHYITQLTKGIRYSLCLFVKGNNFV